MNEDTQNGIKIEKIGMGTKPDPYNFKIEIISEYPKGCIVQANYGGATFGGSKLMVLKGESADSISRRLTLDPHFFENHPIIARFPPNDEGWRLARIVIQKI